MNNNGQLVGEAVGPAGNMIGFVYDDQQRRRLRTTFSDPNGVGTTIVNGINDRAIS